MDINGARVSGAIKADGARVVWHEGWLYVALSPTDVRALEAPEEPKRNGVGYKVAGLIVQRPSCGCKRNAALGRMSREEIVEAGSVSVG